MAAATSSSGVCFLSALRRRNAARACGIHGGNRLALPRTQPLIHHFHRNAQSLFDARGKTLRFLGHFARRAVQVQGQPDDNAANSPRRTSSRRRARSRRRLIRVQVANGREVTRAHRKAPGRVSFARSRWRELHPWSREGHQRRSVQGKSHVHYNSESGRCALGHCRGTACRAFSRTRGKGQSSRRRSCKLG